MLANLFAKPIAWLIAGVVAVLLVWLLWSQFWGAHDRAEQGKQDTHSAEALAETARDAAETVIERADEDATVDELVEAATKEIENAPSDEAAGAAARRAVCQLPEYRNDPACRVQPVHTG